MKKRQPNAATCAVARLALDVDRHMRAREQYKECETTVGAFASVPNDADRVISALEEYALAIPAQSELGALFQIGIVAMLLDNVVDDASRNTSLTRNMIAALLSAAAVMRRHVPSNIATMLVDRYSADEDRVRLEATLAHVDRKAVQK